MKKLLLGTIVLLLAIAYGCNTTPTDFPKVKVEKRDENLYCSIRQRTHPASVIDETYYVTTEIWVGKKYHDVSSMSVEQVFIDKTKYPITTKLSQLKAALIIKAKIDKILIERNKSR